MKKVVMAVVVAVVLVSLARCAMADTFFNEASKWIQGWGQASK